MNKFKKDIRHTVRLTEEHDKKLTALIKQCHPEKTVCQWIRERIESARLK